MRWKLIANTAIRHGLARSGGAFLINPTGAPCGANHVCTMKNNNFKKTLTAFEAQQISATQQVAVKGGTSGEGGSAGVIGNEDIVIG